MVKHLLWMEIATDWVIRDVFEHVGGLGGWLGGESGRQGVVFVMTVFGEYWTGL